MASDVMNEKLRIPTSSLAIKAFTDDFNTLLSSFVDCDSTSFVAFKNCWKSMEFSNIHLSCPNKACYTNYLHTMYSVVFSMLNCPITPNSTSPFSLLDDNQQLFRWNLGVIYLLYSLFQTRLKEDHSPIRISVESSMKLIQIAEHYLLETGDNASKCQNALAIIAIMLRDNVFAIAVYDGPPTTHQLSSYSSKQSVPVDNNQQTSTT